MSEGLTNFDREQAEFWAHRELERDENGLRIPRLADCDWPKEHLRRALSEIDAILAELRSLRARVRELEDENRAIERLNADLNDKHLTLVMKLHSIADEYAGPRPIDSTPEADLEAIEDKIAGTEQERDAYRAMVADLLSSAHPHPTEHPTMTKQWARARELLKNGPSSNG